MSRSIKVNGHDEVGRGAEKSFFGLTLLAPTQKENSLLLLSSSVELAEGRAIIPGAFYLIKQCGKSQQFNKV